MTPRLSVLVPVYNEENTLTRVLDALEARSEVHQLVIVDDCSADGTAVLLAEREFRLPTIVVRHPTNRGKGAALRTALMHADGDLAVVQDADLEYDPSDFPALLAPFERDGVNVVYGTRTFTSQSAFSFWFVVGNRLVALWANLLNNTYITDIETCYKVMPLSLWRSLELRSDGFDIEAEITGKLLRAKERIHEVPISYAARTRSEGKKLVWRDGVRALVVLTRVRVLGW